VDVQAARARKPAQPVVEEAQKHKSQPEHRHRGTYQGHEPGEVIEGPVLAHGREHAGREPDGQGHKPGRRRELDGGGKNSRRSSATGRRVRMESPRSPRKSPRT